MSGSIIRVAALVLLAAALVSSSHLHAQGLGPVSPARGFRYANRLDLPVGAVLGGLVYAPDGRLITYEAGTGEIRYVGGTAEPPLAKFEPAVFGSFLVLAPGGGAVIFAESSGGNVYSVPLASGGAVAVDHIPYAFDLAFDADGRGFVSAPGLLIGNNSIRLLDGDPQTESKEVVTDLAGFSGPVAVDGDGNVYYGTADNASMSGQAVLRFRKAAIDAAVLGDALGASDGEVVIDELGGIYGLKIGGGKFFYTDLGFSNAAPALYMLDPSAGFESSVVATFQVPAGLLSPSYLAFRPGTKDFEAGAGPAAGALAVAFSDFATVSGVGEIIPELFFVRGRVNGDSLVDISDAVAILGFLFAGGETPEVMEAADVNHDGVVDLSDPVYLLDYLFRGGPVISAPYPEPGPDA